MPRPVFVGVSLKAYFGHRESRDWLDAVAALAHEHAAVASGAVSLFVIPTYLGVLPAREILAGTGVLVGAQDVSAEEPGPFTGEVTAAELAEVGVTVAEVGHAERRRLYGETEEVVAAKTAAALRHGLAPVLCLGETDRTDAATATATVVDQLRSALAEAPAGRVIVAYEPVWAIGAPEPAPAEHVGPVAIGLRAALDALPGRDGSAVVYGGSAGPGLLTALGDSVDGLFLGRFAHDPAALAAVLDEAAVLAAARAEGSA